MTSRPRYTRPSLQLLAGASAKNMPNLRNLAMELRKVCCHPVSVCVGLPACLVQRCATCARGQRHAGGLLWCPPVRLTTHSNLYPALRPPLLLQYLCTGLEDDILRRKLEAATAAEAAGGSKVAALSEVDQLVQACGKMVLLHKLLPKLKAEGHKVGWARGAARCPNVRVWVLRCIVSNPYLMICRHFKTLPF